jgi:hypothetical protein
MDAYRAKALHTSKQGVPSYARVPRTNVQTTFDLYVPEHFLPWSPQLPPEEAKLFVSPPNSPTVFCRCGLVQKMQLVLYHSLDQLVEAAIKITDAWQMYIQRDSYHREVKNSVRGDLLYWFVE